MSAPIPADGLRLNGLDIRRHAYRPRDLSALLRVPAKRGADLVIPGEHGELHIPGKRYEAGVVALPLLVLGCDPDTGRVPAGSTARRELYKRMDELIAAIGDEQLLIERVRPDGAERELRGEVLDVLDPRTQPPGNLAEVTVVLKTADPFWSDTADRTGSLTVATGGSGQLTALDSATALMQDLLVEIGPSANPRLEQPASGIFVGWNGIIAADQTLQINTATWTVTGTGGLTVTPADYERLHYGGAGTRRWFALRPEPGGPTVQLTHTGGGTATATVTGRRKYTTA
ncbi:hypothetical protein ACFQE5_23105 [Pseudonocardia hispaniensis]|uniref:Phage tail protein n=1 Tax=Pseudonocardia hispaniensis TaxID=904933 RepID=A0ABW1J9A6_9PSEU